MTVIIFGIVYDDVSLCSSREVTDDITAMTLSVHVLKRCGFLRVHDSE